MNTFTFERFRSQIISISAMAMLFALPTFAQDEDEDAAELGKIEVTGSRLTQTDIETAQPVTIITREDIELSGFSTVAEVLQATPYNSFGSFRETSGYANGQATVNNLSLRGLGSQRTLLLLDGRRVAGTGSSGGAAQNLNSIPTAIVERIEILRDGASAIYGSDAIAGVVNIITKKDFDGIDVSVTSGSTKIGGGDYTRANITQGFSNSKGNMFFTFQHYDRRPQFYNETSYGNIDDFDYHSSYSFPSTSYVSGMDPKFKNAVGETYAEWLYDYYKAFYNLTGIDYWNTDTNGDYYTSDDYSGLGLTWAQAQTILGRDPGAARNPWRNYYMDPRCPAASEGSARALGGVPTSDEFPDSYEWGVTSGGTDYGTGPYSKWCGYNFGGKIMSIPRAKRNTMMMKASYDLTPDVTMNTVITFAHLNGDTVFAGAPLTAPLPTMSATSPNHPLYALYGVKGDGTVGTLVPAGAYDPSSRYLADGTTLNPNYFNCTDPVGDQYLEDGTTPNPDYNPLGAPDCGNATLYMRTVANGTRDNFVDEYMLDVRFGLEGVADIMGGLEWEMNVQMMNNDIDNQTVNLANKAMLQNGLNNGTIDPWSINSTLDETIAQLRSVNHTGTYQADLKTIIGDFITKFDVGELSGGPIGMVLGMEYSHTSFDQLNDPESNAGIIAGSAGGDNINAERSRKSAFMEIGLPFTENFNMSLAGRFDDYSSRGIGSNFSPAINFEYRPLSWILLRGTYGEGFRVGAFDEIYGNQSESFPDGVDTVGCASGAEICTVKQIRTLSGGNPDLGPEESKHWTTGIVMSPLPEFTVQVNAWHTEYTGLITTNSLQREIAAEGRGETNYVYRNDQGKIDYVSLQYNNFNLVDVSGVDFDVNYVLNTDNAGRFEFGLNLAKYTKYVVQTYEDSPRNDRAGEIGLPDLRGTPYIYWGKGDWSVALTGYYISDHTSIVDTDDSVPSFMTANLSMNYQLPWDASISLGAINVTNEEPKLQSDIYGWEPFDFTLYDTRGRTVFLSYQQSL